MITAPTPRGDARLHITGPADATVTVVLGHGAGGGVEAPDLQALATGLPDLGYRVVLVEQPWRVSGRKVAPQPAILDECWLAALESLDVPRRLVIGGRSAGARVACRTAARLDADAVLCLAFPLHPPGRPEKSRADELLAGTVRPAGALVLQGSRDPFGRPAELQAAVPDARVVEVEGATHTLPSDLGSAGEAAIAWLAGIRP